MYNYIRPEKVINALRWLKDNNPLYYDIEISSDWFDSVTKDTEYFNNQSEVVSINVTEETENDINSTFVKLAKDNGYIVHDVPRDGDCLFSAIGCQYR